jgi:hypothetical protein
VTFRATTTLRTSLAQSEIDQIADYHYRPMLKGDGAASDGAEPGPPQQGEEKVFRREHGTSSAESFAELKPQVVLMSVY